MDEHMGQELNFQGDDEPGCNSFEWVQEVRGIWQPAGVGLQASGSSWSSLIPEAMVPNF